MKIAKIFLTILIIFSSPQVLYAAANPPAKPSVAIVEFDVMGELDIADGGAIIAEWMISAVADLDVFALTERVLLKKILAEQKLVMTGLVDEEKTAAKIGRLYGVEAVISGSVFRWGNKITVNARLIDSATGAIKRTAQIHAGDLNKIPAQMKDLAAIIGGTTTQEEVDARLAAVVDHQPGTNTESGAILTGPTATWREDITGMQFVKLPGDCYQMGQSKKEKKMLLQEYGKDEYAKFYADELPRHKVCVDTFWLAAREVNNRQYKLFDPEHDSLDFRSINLNDDTLPAVYVSAEDAKAFAAWLSKQYKDREFKLPSEAEWEFGCRAGTDTPRFWGWDSDEACRFANVHDRNAETCNKFGWPPHDCDDGYAATAPVGSFAPNPFGLYDMLGNVWEWTADVYSADAYKNHTKNNPVITRGGTTQARRGGSWNNQPGSIRCANRGKRSSKRRNNRVGFRLLMVERP